MSKLPRLYKNENSNPIDHNRKIYYIKEEIPIESNEEVLSKIFNGYSHPYTQKVLIKTSNKEYETYLVSKTKQNLLTLDNEVIPIKDILYIQKIDK